MLANVSVSWSDPDDKQSISALFGARTAVGTSVSCAKQQRSIQAPVIALLPLVSRGEPDKLTTNKAREASDKRKVRNGPGPNISSSCDLEELLSDHKSCHWPGEVRISGGWICKYASSGPTNPERAHHLLYRPLLIRSLSDDWYFIREQLTGIKLLHCVDPRL